MDNVLDNPIWNGLLTGNRKFASGNSSAMILPVKISSCAGLVENNESNLERLCHLLPVNRVVTLFSDLILLIPSTWQLLDKVDLFQMFYNGTGKAVGVVHDLQSLDESDIPEMMSLTRLAKPGPFYERTFEFGNYKGIFFNNKLIAMAGYRFQPDPYVEISAVCTHPEFLGKCHAASIISTLINDIIASGLIPYLQVAQINFKAFGLYKNLGFEIRKELILYQLLKK